MKNSIKRVMATMLSLLMIFNIFGIIPAFAETTVSYTNFALGKKVEFGYMEEVSTDVNWGVEAINNGLGALTDGVNDSTNWAVNNVSPETTPDNPYIGLKNTVVAGPYSFTVDLGEVHPVSKASLHSITIAEWSLWTTKKVTYSTSVDGDNWQTVGSVAAEDVIKTSATMASGTAITFFNYELTFDTVNARYVKADFETNPNSNGVHGFGEFEVYGKNIARGNYDISFEYGNVVATNASWGVSAVQGGVYALTDGVKNGPNYWVNNGTTDPTKSNPYIGLNQSYITGPYSFTMDLGEATSVGRIQSYFYDRGDDWKIAAPESVDYYVSADGISWKYMGKVLKTQATTEEVADQTNPTGAQPVIYNYQLGCSADDVRYVKVSFDDNEDSTMRIGLGEIEVYEGKPSNIPEGNIIEAVVMLPEAWNFHMIQGTMTYNENLYYIEGSFRSSAVADMVASEDNGVISFGAESLDGNAYSVMDNNYVLCSAKFVVLNEGELTTVTSDISSVMINTGSSYEALPTTSEVYINSLGNSCGPNVNWSFDETTGTLTISGTGAMYDFTSAVRKPWLSISRDIKNVVIEEGVTTVGDNSFSDCLYIESVSLPSTLTRIGASAFSGSEFIASKLTSIEIPEGVTAICDKAFNFSGLTSVSIPDSVTSIGNYAFAYCPSLTSAKLPSNITTIATGVFSGCKPLANVTIPEGVQTIGVEAFYSCYGLTSIDIPDSVTTIESSAFASCMNLSSVNLSKNLTSIGNGAFNACFALTTVELHDSLTTIDARAFSNCTALESIKIPESVTTIGEATFENVAENFVMYAYINSAAQTYAENNSVTHFILGHCGEKADFTFDPATGALEINGTGDMYDATRENEIPFYSILPSIKSVTINDGITSISDMSFYYCQSLASVEIPDSVTSIGSKAFFRCIGLTAVDIPDTVTEIGSSAFARAGITNVEIPRGVSEISNNAFEMSSLTSVVIPEGVTSIGDNAFTMCSSLTSADIPDSVVSIGDNAFGYCTALENVSLSDGLVSIGNGAFTNTAIYEIILPKSLESIGESAFTGCHNMQTVTIPAGVTTVGTGAFSEISNSFVVYGYCGSAAQDTMKADYIQFLGFGDANNDGELTISDATVIQKYLAKLSEIESPAIFDLNNDGKLSIRDVTYIQMYITKMITEFPITE